MDLKTIIEKLKLIPLPEEGGLFRETYRSSIYVTAEFEGKSLRRTAGTCIYYLVTPDDFSALHKVRGEEIFHFYLGDPVEMIQLTPEGAKTIIIGNNLDKDESPQVIVPPGVWQGSRLKEGGKFALLGCTVSPGFEYEDFVLGKREELVSEFPQSQIEILRFTR
jgi:predicted cupin superfamily sugar epimerase